MMTPDAGGGVPWWMAASVVAGAIVMKGVDWLFARRKERTETDANVELLNQLREGLTAMGARVTNMEAEQAALRQRLDEEIALRMTAQEEAHRLRLRIMTLETAMRQIGAVIPPEARS